MEFRMYLVGLTGGIGSGKTTVGLLFRDAGIPVIDADEVARYVVRLGSDGWAAVYKRFGSEYFDPQTGELDRKALADLVFKDEVARRDLNRITHSRIQKEIGKRLLLLALKWHQFAVIESPLLFESEAAKFVQRIVCVSCDPEERVRRVAARDGLAEDEVWARIEAQMDDAERNRRSHFVIDSHCHVEKLKQRANVVLRDLRSLRLHWPFRCFTAFIALFTLCLVTWPFRALSIL